MQQHAATDSNAIHHRTESPRTRHTANKSKSYVTPSLSNFSWRNGRHKARENGAGRGTLWVPITVIDIGY